VFAIYLRILFLTDFSNCLTPESKGQTFKSVHIILVVDYKPFVGVIKIIGQYCLCVVCVSPFNVNIVNINTML